MIIRTSHLRAVALLLLWLFATSNASGQQLLSAASAESLLSPQTRTVRLVRISMSTGGSVTINADSPINDAVSYKSGDRFVVVVPQAAVGSVQSDMQARDFASFQLEQRGEDLVISFKLKGGVGARLEQRSGTVAVEFSSSTSVAISDSVSTPRAEPTSFTNGDGSPMTSPPVAEAQPNPTAVAAARAPQALDLPSILNSLFPGASDKVSADTTNVELSVPESPAFAVLGLTPSTVVRPASPRAFATSLLNGLDQNGNFQSGLAIDTTPFMLFNGENITIRDYNEQYLTRFLSRTQFSFATAKASSQDDTSTRLSAGLNLTLWDRGDPRIYHPERGDDDVLQCFVNRLELPPIIAPGTPPDEIAKINAGNKAKNDVVADECRDRARKANWNRSGWIIAYAPSWISKTGETEGFKWNGGAFWTSVAYGFEGISSLERIAQLIVHARYRTREQVPDPANQGKFLTQNSAYLGARFRAGSTKFALNFEDSFIRTRVIGGGIDNINRFSIGAEARITNNLYFVFTTGSNIGADDGRHKGFLLTSFKYGFNKKSQFNPQP
jgi:hypothetical protein